MYHILVIRSYTIKFFATYREVLAQLCVRVCVVLDIINPSSVNHSRYTEPGILGSCQSDIIISIEKHVVTTRCEDERVTSFRRYFQHAHFIPIVGVGKRGRISIGPW